MRQLISIFLMAFILMTMAIAPAAAQSIENAEIITIAADDGVEFDGRLVIPDTKQVGKIVIYVNGSGPNTYENRRSNGEIEFVYHDLFAQEFSKRGVAYFSYNTRGVSIGAEPPLYTDIDEALYQTYLPTNTVKDIAAIIRQLKEDVRLKDAKVYLLGWSEGAMVAPKVALAGDAQVDALLLAGYPNGSMADALTWQQTGGSHMVLYSAYFDYDESGDISKEEFEEDRNGFVQYLGDATFEDFDATGDGVISAADFAEMLKENREQVIAAFEGGDDEWLKQNYAVRLTSAWYQDHMNFPTNADMLTDLDLPIHIFHGTYDQNVSVQGVYDIEKAFQEAGKDNLTIHIYPADHDLNYTTYAYSGVIPDGFADIFAVVEALDG